VPNSSSIYGGVGVLPIIVTYAIWSWNIPGVSSSFYNRKNYLPALI